MREESVPAALRAGSAASRSSGRCEYCVSGLVAVTKLDIPAGCSEFSGTASVRP